MVLFRHTSHLKKVPGSKESRQISEKTFGFQRTKPYLVEHKITRATGVSWSIELMVCYSIVRPPVIASYAVGGHHRVVDLLTNWHISLDSNRFQTCRCGWLRDSVLHQRLPLQRSSSRNTVSSMDGAYGRVLGCGANPRFAVRQLGWNSSSPLCKFWFQRHGHQEDQTWDGVSQV